ncbi:ANR family transcriptional regulator [Serratia marcescens]|uniref:ANR family transcriptional regulator n=1 Tax=Serratia marcescens TaxID=615 RepID=UPI001EF05DE2|nr:ANR family transcriptional regulator [Serratia marcescens]ULH10493.1 ANR family transcriptional regulator [Serratia marcescens]
MKNNEIRKVDKAEAGGDGHSLAADESLALYRARACHAAALERMGEYRAAAEAWGISVQAAQDARNRFWCEVRQMRCEKQATEPVGMPYRRRSVAAS